MSIQESSDKISENIVKETANAQKKESGGFFKPPFDLFGMQTSFFIGGEDKTVTWLGFISTIILASAIIAVTIFQTIIFFKNVESKVYINDLILDGPPVIKISNRNFLLMLRHIYPSDGQFAGQINKFLDLQMFMVSANPQGVPVAPIPYIQNYLPLTLARCSDLDLSHHQLTVSQEQLEESLCMDLPQDQRYGGEYGRNEEINFLSFVAFRCWDRAPGDCETMYQGALTSTVTTNTVAAEFFRDYSL